MPCAVCRVSWIVLALLCLQLVGLAQDAPSTVEKQLREIVEELYAASAKEDLEGYMRVWSAKSPELISRRKAMQDLFAANDKIELKTLTISKVKVEGDKASVRVAVETTALDAKTAKPATGFGKMNRALDFVKEEGRWNVWREAGAEEDLALALIEARTNEQRQALLSAEQELISVELWKALIRQGTLQFQQSNYDQALTNVQLALSIAERIGDKEGIAQALSDMGSVSYTQGNYVLAVDQFRRSVMLRKALGDKVRTAISLTNLGTVYGSQGNHRLASQYYQESLVEFESAGNKIGMGAALNNLGNTYFAQGNYGLALENYQRALNYFEAAGYKPGIAISVNNIGNVYQKENNYEAALDYLQKSLQMKEALDNKSGVATSLHNIGEVYKAQGRYDLALNYYQRSLMQFEAIGERARSRALLLASMGLVYYLQGDYTKALEFTNNAAAIAKQIDNREVLWDVRTTEGRVYQALNQPVKARRAFEEAIDTIESLRKQVAGGEQEQQRSFEGKISPYHAMVELLVAQKEPGLALAQAERAKARVLLDVMHSGRVDITKAMTTQEREQEARLRNELAILNSQISRESQLPQPDQTRLADLKARLQKARLQYEAFQTSLYAAHPELRVQRGEARVLTLGEAAALLPDAQSALLQYVVTSEKTYLFVLSKGHAVNQSEVKLKSYVLEIKEKDLSDLASAFRRQLANRDSTFRLAAINLYDKLMKPAQAELRYKQTLIIVPDGALWELPFQALQDATGRYLIENYALSYAPSLTVLHGMSNLRRRNVVSGASGLLAIGNPAFEKQGLDRLKLVHRDEKLSGLPEAEKEVKTLAQLYGAAQSKVYIGAEAREDRFKAEAGRFIVLHLATHGILNDSSPMYSQVVLAPSDQAGVEDGLLEAWEIMNLNLNADLVVLSACESGRGRIGAGEGIIGLSWALFVAGIPTTVVSQWKVESASTTTLMLEFHRNLRAGVKYPKTRVSTAKALQQASLKLLGQSEYRHPFYWAGFVVVGDGN
jgi:CHAT domain-containing protein/tetratricopeptide (TPR) repeat protein